MGGHLSCMYAGMRSSNREPLHNTTSPGVLKVVLACEGRTCEFSEPVKVAELMLEFPNHFVAEFVNDGMQHMPATTAIPVYSKRVSPLPADHDAQLSHVYFLLPMHRLNTRLSADELSLISHLAATPAAPSTATAQICMPPTLAKAVHLSSKVTPLSARRYQEAAATSAAAASGSGNVSIAKSYSVPILELLETVGSMEECDDADKNANQRLHILRSKSWTPKLETIIESYL